MTIRILGKRLLQIAAVLLITIAILLLSLVIIHLIRRESVDDYLPAGAQAYLEIESFRDFYEDVIDLKALEIVLSQEEWSQFFQTVLDFKNNKYSESFLFQQLLNLRTNIVLHEDFSPSLIIDPRIKGMFTRFIPLFINKIHDDALAVTISASGENTLYTLTYNDESEYHIFFKKNLIFISLKRENLLSLIEAGESGEGKLTHRGLEKMDRVSVKNSILDMYLKTDSLLRGFSESESAMGKILTLADFPSYASVSLALSNQQVDIKASADIIARTGLFKDFLAHQASPLGVIRTLPDTTNIYSAVNFKSFNDLYQILLTMQDEFVLEDYDNLLKFLSGMTSREILFSWTGSEAGFFSIETSPEPVVYIKINDGEKLSEVLTSIDKSIALNVSDSLVINDVRINQFEYTPLLKAGMSLAQKSSILPFYIRFKDYLFLSMNPETLSQLVRKEQKGELLLKEKTYKSITARIPKNANFFFFYDLNSTMPRFIAENELLSQLLQEYEKGVISLFYRENKVTFNLSAESSGSQRTTLFPGYPKDARGISSPVIAADITGGDSIELIYLNEKNQLLINDLTNTPLAEYSFDYEGFLSLMPDMDLLYNDTEGGLFKINGEGEIVTPYPQFSEATDSFPPVYTDKGMILYSSLSKEIQHYSSGGILLHEIEVDKNVFSSPLLVGDKLFYYPKSLLGTVFGKTLTGEDLPGWPRNAMGISFSTPFLFKENIGFLTQKGDLNLWDEEGNRADGFPLKLTGVYYSTPVSFSGEKPSIAVISRDGLVSLVGETGDLLTSCYLENMSGKDVKLTVYTPENGGEQILFAYGGSNYLTALNSKLQILPGFPLRGFRKPSFADINKDGSTELISAGYDNKIYIYTLRME